MTLLLDTNALIWSLDEVTNLGHKTTADITNPSNQVFVSDIVILECAIKQRTGKLEASIDFSQMDQILQRAGMQQIAIDGWTAQQFLTIPELEWADPFDRVHMAIAMAKHMTLVTADRQILEADVPGLKLMDARR